MGTVYLARHREMDRLCAVKILHPRLSRDREARERFAREARNASRINHPNVCSVYDFGTSAEGLVFLVMEYVEGRSLGAILTERGTLPIHRAVQLTTQMAAGLDAAHGLGIVHRDLKPDNVIVTKIPDGETVKLVDFGIAKALESGAHDSLTAEGVVVGTPEYMSPEAFAGDPVDRKSDIYSLAMVFYRMVTGTVAHRAKTARETLSRRLVEPAEPLAQVGGGGSHFPRELETAVARALARRPSERPETSGDFARDIAAAVATLPPDAEDLELTVRLDTTTAPVERTVPATVTLIRRRVIIGVLGVIGLALSAVVGRSVLSTVSEGSEPPAGRSGPASGPPAAVVPPILPVSPPSAPSPNAEQSDQGFQTDSADRGEALAPLGLPSVEDIMDSDSGGAYRSLVEQIYAQVERDPVIRARAAFRVAVTYVVDKNYDQARAWVMRAITLNDSTPPSSVQADRGQRYRNYLSSIRKLGEPNLP